MATTKSTKSTQSTASKKTESKATSTRSTAKPTTAKAVRTPKTVKIAPKTAAKAPAAKVPSTTETEPTAVAARTAADATANPTGDLRKREVLAAVTERSGVKRRDAKLALEAALLVLGEAIAEGRSLNLPGLGKLKVVRTKKQKNAHLYVMRMRRSDPTPAPTGGSDPEGPGKDPLAEAAE